MCAQSGATVCSEMLLQFLLLSVAIALQSHWTPDNPQCLAQRHVTVLPLERAISFLYGNGNDRKLRKAKKKNPKKTTKTCQ